MPRLELIADHRRPAPLHIQELAARGALLILVALVAGLLWSLVVDDLLAASLDVLSPCGLACLSAYTPTDWVSTRWLACALLGGLTATPLLVHQLLRFAAPGALPRERRLIRRWFVVMGLLAPLLVVTTWLVLLPAILARAASGGQVRGVEAQYDAIRLLDLAFGVVALELVALATWTTAELAGRLHLVREATLGGWRLRLHGVTLLLAWSAGRSISSDVALLAGLGMILLTDARLRLGLIRATAAAEADRGEAVLDAAGRSRRPALVACACLGACPTPPLTDLPVAWAVHRTDGLCQRPGAMDELQELAVIREWTDLVITGCDGTPTAARWRRTLHERGISVRGLGLLDGPASARTVPAADPGLDLRLALAAFSDPWPADGAPERVVGVLDTAASPPRALRLVPAQRPWNTLPPLAHDEAAVHLPDEAASAEQWRTTLAELAAAAGIRLHDAHGHPEP